MQRSRFCIISTGLLMTAVVGLGAPATVEAAVRSITQLRALRGHLTPGDAPGFPVTISRPGSYRLDDNLVLPPDTAIGIDITADDVTLDLNGFSIIGPRVCPEEDNQVSSCTTGLENPSWAGIQAANDVTIRDGTVRGMGGDGIRAGNNARLLNVTVRWNSLFGVRLGNGSRTEGCVIAQNAQGLVAGDFGIVRGTIVRLNTFAGTSMGAHTGYANSVLTGVFAVLGGIDLGGNIVCDVCP